MNNLKNKIKKVCNTIRTDEIYFTCSDWKDREVEGVKFLPVVKNDPSIDRGNQVVYYIRKDSLKFI